MESMDKKDPQISVYELRDGSSDTRYGADDERSLRRTNTHLPSKSLHQYRRNTFRNYIIIIGALLAYGACVTGSIVPGLMDGFPFPTPFASNRYILADDDVCTRRDDTFAINVAFGEMSFKQVKVS